MRSITLRFYDKEELTAAERKQIRAGDVRVNSVRCKKCNDVIVSNNRHDFKTCKCGSVSVDGGSWYCKRVFKTDAEYEELSEYYIDRDDKDGT
jgi:hypothetical protein